MSIDHPEVLPEVGSATEGARSLSILQQAEQRRAQRENNLFLDVPSWNGDLVCEYRVLSKKELVNLAEQQSRLARANNWGQLDADVEFILRAAVGLWLLDPESGDRIKVEDDIGHVSYDRIATVLNVDDEIKTQKEAVKYLMAQRAPDGGWQENATAVALHAQALSRWMKDPSKRTMDLEELLGEL